MKILMIAKYPPIQGGTTSQVYWTVRGLGQRNHQVFVATNAWEVERKYRVSIPVGELNGLQPKGVEVYSSDPLSMPRHIPFSPLYTEKLAGLGLSLVKEEGVALIDSWYLAPYASAAAFVAACSGKPFSIHHAGSDVTRLLQDPYLGPALRATIQRANRVFVSGSGTDFISPINKAVTTITKLNVDVSAFSPSVRPLWAPSDTPTFLFAGKPERRKGLAHILDEAARVKSPFKLVLLTNLTENPEVEQQIRRRKLKEKVLVMPFVPPWMMPSIYRSVTAVLSAEHNFPILGHATRVPREAMACGTCPILSNEVASKYPYSEITDGREGFIFNPKPGALANVISALVRKPELALAAGKRARRFSEKHEDFQGFLRQIEGGYRAMLEE